jgi:ubiquinone/menaquinone biosynthesis C-methylase UbiE
LPDLDAIYRTRADDYDRLVAREDHAGNILRAIGEVAPLAGADVVEFGAGTGRLTALLAPRARSILACDASDHMLERARANLERLGLDNWRLEAADHRSVPAPAGGADLAVAGWTIHAVADEPSELRAALDEMGRVLRPGGTVVILETLGTGHTEPHPPPELIPYYDHLAKLGFQSRAFRTDYVFTSLAEAEELTRFFFGDALADAVAHEQTTIVAECTGLWWRATQKPKPHA